MGPLVTRAHLDKVVSYLDAGTAAGATMVVDGRARSFAGDAEGLMKGVAESLDTGNVSGAIEETSVKVGTVTLLLGVFALSAAAITVGMYLSLLAVGSIWGLIGLKRGNLFWWRRLRSPEEEIPVVWRIALPVSRSPSEFAPSESIPGVEVVSDAALAATGTMSSNVCSGDDRATSAATGRGSLHRLGSS
jgi:hypothetical protein